MAEINERIERFKNMADADPGNELGHFSLGRAYMEAGRYAEAIDSLKRAIVINRNLSKAYQFVGQSQLKLGQQGDAVATLTEGVKVADARGDVLPRNEMIEQLKSLGAAVPELKASTAKLEVGEGQVMCRRCGQVKPRLPSPPFKGEFGKLVYENTCAQCWREAIGQGTKVINEMRLGVAPAAARHIALWPPSTTRAWPVR